MTPASEKEYRALLTAREEEIISREADVNDSYYYRVVSRVRDKIERLGHDMEVLDANHPGLASEARREVCDGDSNDE